VSEPPGATPSQPPDGGRLRDLAGRSRRAQATPWRGASDGAGPRVVHIDPPDGAHGVFRDAPVVARFSRAMDPLTLSPRTFVVMDEDGSVAGGVWTSLDGRVAVWTPERLLSAGRLHCVRLCGVRDHDGREVAVHESVFVPGDLALGDLGP
jgi:Bacterial Ig-like domain